MKLSSGYKVSIHKNGRYQYASTQPLVDIDKNGKRCYKRLHWGIVDNNKFYPNKDFLLLPNSEKRKFIFPETWDISEIHSSNIPDQYSNKLYGDIWLLEQITEKLGLREDLLETFDNRTDIVDAILTLAYYKITQNDSYNHINSWQKIVKTPIDYSLTPQYITKLSSLITDNHRIKFFITRFKNTQSLQNDICAIDSTSVSCTSDKLVDARFGKNKDGDTLPQTNEVVVYGLKSHLPLYYRTLPGNMPDIRSLETIMNDLKTVGMTNHIFITDRGYGSMDNLKYYQKNNIACIMGVTTSQYIVTSRLRELDLDVFSFPDWDFDDITETYSKQYKIEKNTNLNIYIDINRRFNIFKFINKEMTRQRNILDEYIKNKTLLNKDVISKKFKFYDLNFKDQELISYVPKGKTIKTLTNHAGIYANITYNVNLPADEVNHLYRTRDEQEKYFAQMKGALNSNRHRTSNEYHKIGRQFILFISQIIACHLQYLRKEHLADIFPSNDSILKEMRSIRYVTNPDREDFITPFIGKQHLIVESFGFTFPEGCGSENARINNRVNSGIMTYKKTQL